MESTLTITDVARLAGVSVTKVRYYDDKGVLPSRRTSGNQRRFTATDACRIRIVALGQRVGLTIADLKAKVSQVPDDPAPEDWEQLSSYIYEAALRRRAQLDEVLDVLTGEAFMCGQLAS
jgi:MerR family redox-sensitive transcriptional activator SoxR